MQLHSPMSTRFILPPPGAAPIRLRSSTAESRVGPAGCLFIARRHLDRIVAGILGIADESMPPNSASIPNCGRECPVRRQRSFPAEEDGDNDRWSRRTVAKRGCRARAARQSGRTARMALEQSAAPAARRADRRRVPVGARPRAGDHHRVADGAHHRRLPRRPPGQSLRRPRNRLRHLPLLAHRGRGPGSARRGLRRVGGSPTFA